MIWATGVVDVDKALTIDGVAMAELSPTIAWDGYLLINATVSVLDTNDVSLTHFWIQVDNPACYPDTASAREVDHAYATIGSDATRESASLTGAIAVTAGSHTLTLCGNAVTANDTHAYDPSMTALFSPLGEVPSP